MSYSVKLQPSKATDPALARGPTIEEHSIGGYNYDYARSLVRRYRAELPQGRNAARVGTLWRVCEGSLKVFNTCSQAQMSRDRGA